MSLADEGKGLNDIERSLADDDPGLAEAFRHWQLPTGVPEAQRGDTTAPPWVLGVFVTAALSWVVSPGFGALAAAVAVALSWLLLTADQPGRDRPGRGRAADGKGVGPSTGAAGPDDGELPPQMWGGRWI